MTTNNPTLEDMVDESHALIEGADPAELMLEAKDAAEPGGEPGEVIHRPTLERPIPTVLGDVESAGYKVVYHTVTREPSVVNANMLSVQLSKMTTITGSDGQLRSIRAFTTRPPATWTPPAPPPDRGTLLCIFHKDSEMYAHYKTIGVFPMPTDTGYCPKSNMVTLMDVRMHAQHRHKNEWESVEADRTQTIESEEREIRRMTVENLRADREERDIGNAKTLACELCEWGTSAPRAASRRNAMYRHKKEKHPELG